MLNDIKSLIYAAWRLSFRLVAERRRWWLSRQAASCRVGVFYGHERIPTKEERSGGALIKFQDLEEEFPNTCRGAKILYLVSSALPDFPEIMVREAKRQGVVFVLNQNGVAYHGWHGEGWEKKNKPMRWLLRHADFVVYQSKFCKTGADRFLGDCESPWEILYNPVDTEIFVPSRIKFPGLKILIAGSHQHFYRVSKALEALQYIAEKMPEATLTIAGRYTWRKSEDECLAEAKDFAEMIGVIDRVTFGRSYTQAEATALFQKHHVLMHTKYNDPCPRLVIEAMSCGLPIIYSKSGGVEELVGEAAGIGVPAVLDWQKDHPPDPVCLAEATLKISASYEMFSKAARQRAVQRFDVRPWRERHASIFRKLIMENNRTN